MASHTMSGTQGFAGTSTLDGPDDWPWQFTNVPMVLRVIQGMTEPTDDSMTKDRVL